MNPSTCLRSFSRLALDKTAQPAIAARSLLSAPQASCFSTSSARYANPQQKKKGVVAAPKKGTKTLNVKRGKSDSGRDMSKRPGEGERKAARKRIVLSNNNALEVRSLKDLNKENVLGKDISGKVMGLPEDVVDQLRIVEAFKPTQGWSMFRRPAVLMRKEAMQLAELLKQVEDAEKGQKPTISRVLTGDRLSGKSTLLLQGLSMAFLRNWVVINLPEAQDITNAHTDYAPLRSSKPIEYTQDMYTSRLLSQISRANAKVLESLKVSAKTTLVPAGSNLKQLAEAGVKDSEVSWPAFSALMAELMQPGRPPMMLGIDGLAHIMKQSDYLDENVNPIHAHDLALIRVYTNLLSGKSSLPNGGLILAATSGSNAPTSPAMEFSLQVAEARQSSSKVPEWNPYKSVDERVMECLKNIQVIKSGGMSKGEARTLMEYYAESGMLRARVDEPFVSQKWSLAGMGNVGELERASVTMRI